jgi:isopenicillin-N epimerase
MDLARTLGWQFNMNSLSELFLLDPEIIFLNHGSFGACPIPVFEIYQAWQRPLETRPVEFLGRRFQELMAQARARLGEFLGAAADDLVYFTNPTTAINMVARNLPLRPGDEILTSNHEYGALDRTWNFICRQRGASYIQRPVCLPVESAQQFTENFWEGVTSRTRVIFLSHITSPTALIFPIAEICRRARQAGILTVIDGAHAPGQIDLNLAELDPDLYAGACHKWLMAPKGAAFLYASRRVQSLLDPLVVSWGYESEQPGPSRFIDYHEWQGTRDPSAFLSVPAAIDFQVQHDWAAVRKGCHELAAAARRQIERLTGLAPICPDTPAWFAQMFSARLPQEIDPLALQRDLYEKYRIEVPILQWNNQNIIRASFQGYNSPADSQALVNALGELL